MFQETVKIVICGDDNIGKTSLILSLLKDEFVSNLQDVLMPLTISKDSIPTINDSSICDNTILIDTNNEDLFSLKNNLKLADVIWLVYSDHESYERISFHWMTMFRSMGLNIPVILCKNKCDDLLDDTTFNTKVEDEEFIPILMEFKEIETCIKTSAKNKYNVIQTFYLCQRTIICPIAPLFDARIGDLKPLAKDALQRIFLLADLDQDGFLNDDEFNFLQIKCFHQNINLNELENIKQLLLSLTLSMDNDQSLTSLYTPNKGITSEGFLELNKMYAEKGRHETIWGILRAFKYTDSLSIDDSVLHPKLNLPFSSSVELSPKGYRFLVDLFIRFDKDKDGGLDDNELLSLFKTTPGIPKLWSSTNFPYSTVINKRGFITLQGWLAQWAMTTFIDFNIVTEYLVYFGFEEDARLALTITKSRRYRRRSGKFYRSKVNDRKVFNCLLLGKKFCGKTSLLEKFLGRNLNNNYSPTLKPQMAVNSLELKGGKQYYLILQELGELQDNILKNKQELINYDVVLLTYDSSDPNSFSYLTNLLNQFEYIKELPIIFVGLKADLDKQRQRCIIQPDQFCENMYISHPLHISAKWLSSLNELFIKITEAALVPANNTPDLLEEDNSTLNDIDYRQAAVIAGSTIAFVSLLSFTLFKFINNQLNKH